MPVLCADQGVLDPHPVLVQVGRDNAEIVEEFRWKREYGGEIW